MRTPFTDLKINRNDVGGMLAAGFSLLLATVVVDGKRPLWFDEVYSWTLVTDPSFAHMMHALRAAAESPPGLFHVLARVWLMVSGESTLALRLFATTADCAALVVLWLTLRRAFSLRATAIGVLTVFCTSAMMLLHSAEARFYPLFVACVAVAIAAYARAAEARAITWRLGLALFLSNMALVQVHVYGIAYSAALLLALLLCDVAGLRWRPPWYLSVMAAWFTLLPWLPTLRRVNEQTRPRHWIEPPTLSGVTEFYRLYSTELPLVLFCVAVLCVLGRVLRERRAGGVGRWNLVLVMLLGSAVLLDRADYLLLASALMAITTILAGWGFSRDQERRLESRRVLLVAAAVLVAAPPAAGLFSLLVRPVFIPKYVLPSMLGMAVLIAWVVDLGLRATPEGVASRALGAGWMALILALVAMPLYSAWREDPHQAPRYGVRSADVEALVPPGIPIAVENFQLFLPLQRSTTRGSYVYVGDPDAAATSASDPAALLHYRGSRLWKDLGYLPSGAPDWQEFLAEHPAFAVLHSPRHFWFAWRIRDNPAYRWRSLGTLGPHEVLLVERVAGTAEARKE